MNIEITRRKFIKSGECRSADCCRAISSFKIIDGDPPVGGILKQSEDDGRTLDEMRMLESVNADEAGVCRHFALLPIAADWMGGHRMGQRGQRPDTRERERS